MVAATVTLGFLARMCDVCDLFALLSVIDTHLAIVSEAGTCLGFVFLFFAAKYLFSCFWRKHQSS